MKLKKTLSFVLAVAAISGFAFSAQSFTTSDATASAPRPKFVKTSSRCSNSNCSCSGYWGYKHQNGTYEGSCSNTDGHGHTCGHGPEKHGLRKW